MLRQIVKCTGSDTSRKCWFWQRRNLVGCVCMMRHASKNTRNEDEQIILLLSQVLWFGMLRTTLDSLAEIGPPAIKTEVFPRNESDGTRFSKFHCKRLPPNGEAVGHPRLLFLAWKNIIFCYYFKLFSFGYPRAQHSMALLSADITLVPPFWSGRYLAEEGCNSLIW